MRDVSRTYERTIDGRAYSIEVDAYDRGEGPECFAELFVDNEEDTAAAGYSEGENQADAVRDMKEDAGSSDELPAQLVAWMDEVAAEEERRFAAWVEQSMRQAGLK